MSKHALLLPGLLFAAMASSATTASAVTLLSADFNASNGGFTVTNSATPPDGPWVWDGAGAWSVIGEDNLGAPTSSELVSPAFVVPGGASEITVAISHRYNFEIDTTVWDGGHMQYSIDGGAWTNVSAAFTSNGYTATVGGNNALNGLSAWTGASAGYATGALVNSQVTIPGLAAGNSVSLRFQGGWDEFTTAGAPNWQIDSVSVDAVPEPASAAFLAAATGLLTLRRRRR